MQELIARVLGNNLADFEGLEISGTIPLRDAFVNDAIASVLESLKQDGAGASPAAAGSSSGAGSSRPEVDVKTLLPLVRKIEVESQQGAILVRFEVKR